MPITPDDPQNILEYSLIPGWERYGVERLVISESTLEKFKAQDLPPMVNVSIKKRKSKKVRVQGPRIYNDLAMTIEAFPEDGQDTCRHPILYYVIKGQADLHIADYVVHCPAGHFVLMRPGVPQPDGKQPHLEAANSYGYCEILHLSLLPGASSVASWICYSDGSKHWARYGCVINKPDVVHQFHFFMNEMLDKPVGYHKTATNSLHNFLLLFQRELKEGRLQPTSGDNTRQRPVSGESQMEFALQYLESHLHQRLTSAKVAEAVFMSRSSFLRHFSRETGQSFNQYLTELRLEKAKQLLADSARSVHTVSGAVGVQPAQLYRIFKANLGMSPSEFQDNHKNGTK